MQTEKFKSVDEYIATFPESTQELLQQLRKIIKDAAPQAEEVISYNMPAYKINWAVAYYAGYKNHIGLYAMPNSIETFKDELKDYKISKGTVQLPLEKPLDADLITRMVHHNILMDAEYAREKAEKKAKKKK